MNHTKTTARTPWALQSLALILTLLLSVGSFAQDKKLLTGVVSDNAGVALPGATILETATKKSVVTDENGKYTIEVTSGNTIEISFIGFETHIAVVNASTPSTLNVSLKESATMLDAVELVSVGYGKMRKSDLTGSISTVRGDDLVKGVVASTEQALQGKVAGLSIIQGTGDPASGATMRLRGGTSLTANNSPLVVVDGVAGVDINIVQPQDIKSVDVLKDASATAIYGSRGANGVIIITTKAGTKSSSVTYSGLTGISEAANNLDLLSANQWRQYVRENNIADAVDYGGNTDWQKELQQQGFMQQHNLGLTSGGEESGLRASLSYLKNEGVIKTTELERLSGNISGYQYALNKALKFDVGLFANIDKWHPLDYRVFERSFNLNPTIPVYNNDGSFTEVGGTLYENPVEILTNRRVDNERHRLLGTFKTEAKLFRDLTAIANLSLEHNAMQGATYKPTYAVLEGRTENGYAQRTYSEYTTAQAEVYLQYAREFGKHNVNVMGGYSYLENVYDGFGAQRSGFETDLFSYNNLGAGSNYRLGDVYSYKGKSNLVSIFGRLNYAFDSRYMLTATVRRDGSSRFGDNNKWGVFPSAAVAWTISNEKFMDATDNWLTNLKFRAGIGVTGNQDGIGEYKSLSILGVGRDSYYDPETGMWSLAYAPIQNPNADLKWESTRQTNIGIDFSLWNRITGTFEWYQKETNDLLYTYQVPQPPYLVGTMLANVGDLSNKGIELSLNADIVKNEKFTWNTNLVFGKNKQKIERLSNQTYQADVIYSGSLHGLAGMSNQFSQVIAEQFAVGTFWGREFYGFNEAGEEILSEDYKVIGDVQPDFTMGVGMNFTYKNFDLGWTGYGMFGNDALNATAMMLSDPNRMPSYNIPDAYYYNYGTTAPTYSSRWIEDASFFRLQTVSLGYTIPFKESKSKLRLYVLGQNLAVITGYNGVDPEIPLVSGDDQTGLANPGIDRFNNFPRPRTFSVGLNFTLGN
ncbi:SusC/RagA family TonB-linked outer membrane protein [Flavobacterium caeni]|uniref:Iron complex outermembrane recepter protein n=1 Tax=Flavobacterium caeni TaxID=490189 RepID=A0A1G5E1V8_9FLAO|nr:SusC/RagA family TonB-linked outer membrane protein [Flavobacterium caeni]SCY20972.1 iron complex outermembrane recepter protein [Flavobacterium caeni]